MRHKKRFAGLLGGALLGLAAWATLLSVNFGIVHASTTAQFTAAPAQAMRIAITPALTQNTTQTLQLFNANTSDLVGPADHDSNYGKAPEIIVATANGISLTVLAQTYATTEGYTPTVKAVIFQLEPDSTGEYTITQALLLSNTLTNTLMLDRIMGLDVDSAGNRYYATGVDEGKVISSTYPAPNEYRSNIVRVIKMNQTGRVLLNVDLDLARVAAFPGTGQIINPMWASTSRLLVAGNEIALAHGIATEPDWDIGGTRHQRAVATRLNATTGEVTAAVRGWVSHSFDQRLLRDGNSILEYHLGDAFPRAVTLIAPGGATNSLFRIKGFVGENQTRTRIGNVAVISASSEVTYTYVALFATESVSQAVQQLDGPRNLAIQRVSRTDFSIDPTMPDVFTSTVSEYDWGSGGYVPVERPNRLQWLTHYTATYEPVPNKTPIVRGLTADRPKLVAIGNNQFVVLWEEWYVVAPPYPLPGSVKTFQGVYGLVIDATGAVIVPATLLTTQYHLPRGDDAFRLGNGAAWMTADGDQLQIHAVAVADDTPGVVSNHTTADVSSSVLGYTNKSIVLPVLTDAEPTPSAASNLYLPVVTR